MEEEFMEPTEWKRRTKNDGRNRKMWMTKNGITIIGADKDN